MRILAAAFVILLVGCPESDQRIPSRTSVTRYSESAGSGEVQTLNGQAAVACGDLIYQWTQAAGPTVQLAGNPGQSPTFVAPNVTEPTILTFNVVASASGSVTIEVLPVTTDAALDQAIDVGLDAAPDQPSDVGPDVADAQPIDTRPPPLGVFSDVTVASGLAAIVGHEPALSWCFGVTMEDIDGDGANDIFVGNHGPARRLAFGSSTGSFTEGVLPSWNAQTWHDIIFDFDNNGLQDIAQLFDSVDYAIMRHLGGRQFVATGKSDTIQTYSNGMAWSDWNGDGLLDYAMTKQTGGNRWWAGTGAGKFSLAAGNYGITSTAHGTTSALFAADLNGDDLPDFLLQEATRTTTAVRVALNSTNPKGGPATFAAPSDAGLVNANGPAIALGDFDNDGDLDVFSMGETAASWSRLGYGLFRNDGTGHFAEVTAEAGLPTGTRAVSIYQVLYLHSAFLDFDGDGWLDIVAIEEAADRLFRNDGAGHFVEVTGQYGFGGAQPSGRPSRLSIGDLDGDHAQDIVTMRSVYGSPCDVRVFHNGVRTDNGLSVKLSGAVLKNAIGSKLYLYERNPDGNNGALAGYREVILSTTHRAPLEQYFALQLGKSYNLTARFWPSGATVETLDIRPGRIVITEP